MRIKGFARFDMEKVFSGTDSLADRALVSSGTRTDTSPVLAGDSELFLRNTLRNRKYHSLHSNS